MTLKCYLIVFVKGGQAWVISNKWTLKFGLETWILYSWWLLIDDDWRKLISIWRMIIQNQSQNPFRTQKTSGTLERIRFWTIYFSDFFSQKFIKSLTCSKFFFKKARTTGGLHSTECVKKTEKDCPFGWSLTLKVINCIYTWKSWETRLWRCWR